MARFPAFCNSQFSEESGIWDSLKSVIAASSGFQSWQIERLPVEAPIQELNLDHQVRRYLRETLETLAY